MDLAIARCVFSILFSTRLMAEEEIVYADSTNLRIPRPLLPLFPCFFRFARSSLSHTHSERNSSTHLSRRSTPFARERLFLFPNSSHDRAIRALRSARSRPTRLPESTRGGEGEVRVRLRFIVYCRSSFERVSTRWNCRWIGGSTSHGTTSVGRDPMG